MKSFCQPWKINPDSLQFPEHSTIQKGKKEKIPGK